jgi:RNA recognition motif-containing protein
MKTIFVNNIAGDASDDEIRQLFTQHGTVRELKVVRDIFTNQCRGFGTINMEGHEARAAIAALNGAEFKGRPLKVGEEKKGGKKGKRGGRR